MEISEDDIASWLGSADASKGERYQREGRVSDLRKSSDELRAQCQGSQPEPYTVRVRVQDGGYQGSTCSCPLGGACKHAAAVLYEVARSESELPEAPQLARRLDDLSRERLVEWVAEYAERHPEFESWIEAKLKAVPSGDEEVDRTEMRQRVDEIVSRAAKSHRYGRPAEFDQLGDLLDAADARLEDGSPRDAANIYGPVAWGVLERYNWFDPSGGGILPPVIDATRGLIEVFDAASNSECRSRFLREIWEIWWWDVDFGGVLGTPGFFEAFVDATEEPERDAVAQWTREKLEELGPIGDEEWNWAHRRLGELLVALEGDDWTDAESEAIAERTGLRDWWARELLERGEVERAASVAGDLESYRQLQLADDFVEREYSERAIELLERVADEAPRGTASKARQKLVGIWESRDAWQEAAEVAHAEFEARPKRGTLQELERLARRADCWEALEAEALNTLVEEAPGELIWYYIEDGDVDAAVAIWDETEVTRSFDRAGFAESIAENHPERAVEVLDDEAERLIDARGRGNYRKACRHIAEIRDIFQSHDAPDAWRRRRDELLDRHSNLPAFQDEMEKAGLTEAAESSA